MADKDIRLKKTHKNRKMMGRLSKWNKKHIATIAGQLLEFVKAFVLGLGFTKVWAAAKTQTAGVSWALRVNQRQQVEQE